MICNQINYMNRRTFIAFVLASASSNSGLAMYNMANRHKLPIMQLLESLNNSFSSLDMASKREAITWVKTIPDGLDVNTLLVYIKTCINDDYMNNRVDFANNILLSRTEIMLFSLKQLNA